MRTRQPFLRNSRPKRKVPVLPILLVLSVLANAWFLWRWEPQGGDGRLTEAVKEVAGSAEDPVQAPPLEPTPAPEPVAPEEITGARLVKVTINGAVARAFSEQIGKEDGNRLAITCGRLYAWWLDVTTDPRKGDTTAVLYEPDEPDLGPDDILLARLRPAARVTPGQEQQDRNPIRFYIGI